MGTKKVVPDLDPAKIPDFGECADVTVFADRQVAAVINVKAFGDLRFFSDLHSYEPREKTPYYLNRLDIRPGCHSVAYEENQTFEPKAKKA